MQVFLSSEDLMSSVDFSLHWSAHPYFTSDLKYQKVKERDPIEWQPELFLMGKSEKYTMQ